MSFTKLIAAAILFVACLLSGTVAMLIHRHFGKRNDLIMSFIKGTMISTIFVHILSESEAEFTTMQLSHALFMMGLLTTKLIGDFISMHQRSQTDNLDVDKRHASILFFLLSLHELFEGFLFGISVNELWLLLTTIGFHKILLSFYFTIELRRVSSTLEVVLMMFFYAIVTPIGMGIGHLVSSMNVFYVAITQCISSGIIFYMIFSDMMNNDLINQIVVILGFSCYCIIDLLTHQHHI